MDDTVLFDSGHESDNDGINTPDSEQQNMDEWVRDPHLGAWFKENSQAEKEMIMT